MNEGNEYPLTWKEAEQAMEQGMECKCTWSEDCRYRIREGKLQKNIGSNWQNSPMGHNEALALTWRIIEPEPIYDLTPGQAFDALINGEWVEMNDDRRTKWRGIKWDTLADNNGPDRCWRSWPFPMDAKFRIIPKLQWYIEDIENRR